MVTVDRELLAKYDRPGPRYTSYPTAPIWRDDYGAEQHAENLARSKETPTKPLSVYVHLPFCESMCFYCACNVVISQDHAKGTRYVDDVLTEARLVRETMGVARPVVQHHWGGGTPTFLPPDDLERLFVGLRAIFPLADDAEVSIEVDPRVTTVAQLEALRRAGFDRLSMGVQDFDPKVQETIHRVQSFEMTRDLAAAARALGFTSVNVDLVYGLPFQSVPGFEKTLARVLEMRPDRVACYSYAHVPWLKKHQRVIPEAELPRGAEKLELYVTALQTFTGSGYDTIGMDHFALSTDELARAAAAGRLHRNFMGYTTRPAEDMVGLGVTAIGEMAGAFAQNEKVVAKWQEKVREGRLPIERGMQRSAEDELRRRVILDVMCRFKVDMHDYGGPDAFRAHFAEALADLSEMADDGLIEIDAAELRVTEVGRLLVRNLAMTFDAYLKDRAARFSRTV